MSKPQLELNAQEALQYAMYALTEMKALLRATDSNYKRHSEYQVADIAERKIADYFKAAMDENIDENIARDERQIIATVPYLCEEYENILEGHASFPAQDIDENIAYDRARDERTIDELIK